MLKKVLMLIVILFLGTFHLVGAQSQGTDISLDITPSFPSPNQNVSATVSTVSFDLNHSNITWLLNGTPSLEGIGKKEFSFSVGDAGSQTSVEVKILAPDGNLIDKVIVINPAGMDLLWEAYDSYAPPFYKGKKLVPSEGSFKVVAIPNLQSRGQRIPSSNLSYNWKQDNEAQQDLSGYGKDYYVFKNNYLDNDNTVEVTASSVAGNSVSTKSITLTPGNPKIVFYEKDPTTGIKWEKSLQNGFFIPQGGTSIVAMPYFFSPNDISSSDMTFDWSFNGSDINTPSTKNILSVKPGTTAGQTAIKVNIKNATTYFQELEKELDVSF
ncbi:MAG: hypothetical protein V4439_02115 [Patescibacteria group bacterium]